MKPPEKRQKIYESIKGRFKTGEFYPGSRLPNELELAEEYGVALGTMRSALKLLEDENMIVSIKGAGTFAKRPRTPKGRPLTFLLPCPDFLQGNNADATILGEVFSGCLKAAFSLGLTIEAMPVSPSNNPEDIDFGKLNLLGAESRVIVTGAWFEKTFPLLLDRKCRVCSLLMEPKSESWLNMTISEARVCEDALLHLEERGCKKIAIASKYVREKNNPCMKVGMELAKRREWPAGPFFCNIPSGLSKDTDLAPILTKLWDETHFDGLFLLLPSCTISNPKESLNINIGIPKSARVITGYDADFNQALFPSVSAISRPFRQMGHDAVNALARDEFIPAAKVYDCMVIARQSTSS